MDVNNARHGRLKFQGPRATEPGAYLGFDSLASLLSGGALLWF